LEYIPTFIKRKHGLEKITYDLPEMEELLKETYGITVYQEQVMLLSQKLAGFSKGDADVLRKAMGKKDRATLDKMKGKFLEGTAAKGLRCQGLRQGLDRLGGLRAVRLQQIHSTCYAFVAYQTAWLKANYPSEYMASVLTHSAGQIDKITFFMEECRRMGISVLGPGCEREPVAVQREQAGADPLRTWRGEGCGRRRRGSDRGGTQEPRWSLHQRLRPDAAREPAQLPTAKPWKAWPMPVPSISPRATAHTSSTARRRQADLHGNAWCVMVSNTRTARTAHR
jgi:hypothetical protein